jgi:hypothetical protein
MALFLAVWDRGDRKLLPLALRSKAIQIEVGPTVDGGVGDLDDAPQALEGFLVHVTLAQEFRVALGVQ